MNLNGFYFIKMKLLFPNSSNNRIALSLNPMFQKFGVVQTSKMLIHRRKNVVVSSFWAIQLRHFHEPITQCAYEIY